MSSFLWLLLYLVPLLGVTAALFAWLGWRWSGSDLRKRIDELRAELERVRAALSAAESRHATELEERTETRTAAEKSMAGEMQMLREELKSAKSEARLRQEEAVKACEGARALEAETDRMLRDLEQLRAEHAAAQAEVENLRSARAAAETGAALPEAAESAADAPSKRKRSTAAKPKSKAATGAAAATLREKIEALEGQLTTQEAGISGLKQERDDWQRRINDLEGHPFADAAELALARKSLADREKRLTAATGEVERLRNHARVLQRAEATAAALSSEAEDDLTQIKGIKKITSEQLRAHGIRTWRQIALWDEEEQRAFGEILSFKNRATREKWQAQARALHEATHGPLP